MSDTLALGAFIPGWRGPERLLLKLVGERIAEANYQHDHTEHNWAERMAGMSVAEALDLVRQICAGCACAHTMAFCQALEALYGVDIPERAAWLRCAFAEIERLTSHLGALDALFEALGFTAAHSSFSELQDLAYALQQSFGGPPALAGQYVPGGVKADLADEGRNELQVALAHINRRLFQLADRLIDQRALLARTVDVGTLTRDVAGQYLLHGPMARASALAADLRTDQPYAAYASLEVRPVTQEGGDVYARLVVLLLEALESCRLAEHTLQELPSGAWYHELPRDLPAGQAQSVVEAPRGLLRYSLESDGRRLSGAAITLPRQVDRLLARTLLSGALLDNVVLILLSTAPCPACGEG